MSIKICVITPISHLEEYASLGEMDMSLSHIILEDSERGRQYAEYYKRQREAGRFVLLDNSAFELEQQGKGLDPDPVLDAAEITNPSEVIATDVLFDGQATIESTNRFIERMRERGVLGKYKVMAVPQGKSVEEWWECYEHLIEHPEVDTIGLSKLSVPMSYLGEKESNGNCTRSRLLCTRDIEEDLRRRWWDYPNNIIKQFHLLGGDNCTPYELSKQTRYPWIRSNDSSCAVWYGRYRRVYDREGKIDSGIVMEKPDLENHNPATAKTLSNAETKTCILENITRWHMLCKGEPCRY